MCLFAFSNCICTLHAPVRASHCLFCCLCESARFFSFPRVPSQRFLEFRRALCFVCVLSLFICNVCDICLQLYVCCVCFVCYSTSYTLHFDEHRRCELKCDVLPPLGGPSQNFDNPLLQPAAESAQSGVAEWQ